MARNWQGAGGACRTGSSPPLSVHPQCRRVGHGARCTQRSADAGGASLSGIGPWLRLSSAQAAKDSLIPIPKLRLPMFPTWRSTYCQTCVAFLRPWTTSVVVAAIWSRHRPGLADRPSRKSEAPASAADLCFLSGHSYVWVRSAPCPNSVVIAGPDRPGISFNDCEP